MTFEPFDDGTRLMEKGRCKVGVLTIAQQIRAMGNPYLRSIASPYQVRRQIIDSADHLTDKKVFYFEDGSYLTFEVSYMAVEDGKE